jgi:hypothetical protein
LLLVIAVAIFSGCAGIPHSDFAASGHDQCDCGAPECGDACNAEMHSVQTVPFQGVWSSAMAVSAIPMTVVGNVANFCLPVVAMAPPEVPPPGRFHPVPTRPVFQAGPPAF